MSTGTGYWEREIARAHAAEIERAHEILDVLGASRNARVRPLKGSLNVSPPQPTLVGRIVELYLTIVENTP